jgi:hypothetical protein
MKYNTDRRQAPADPDKPAPKPQGWRVNSAARMSYVTRNHDRSVF